MKPALLAALLLALPASGEDRPLPEGLVAEGIPAVPADLAAAVDRYTHFRSASLAAWHPERREMLVLTRFAETVQVHRVKGPGADRSQLSFLPEGVDAATWSPRQPGYFLFQADVGGGERYQTYRFDLATGAITLLTDGKSRNSLGPWSKAGNLLAYTSTRRTGKDTDLYLMDPADPKCDRLLARMEGGGWSPLDWAPDDKTLLVLEYVSANESHLWTVDAASGEKTALTPRDGQGRVYHGAARFSRDGKGIYVISDRDSEFRTLAHLDLATKRHTPLSADLPWDVEEIALSPDGGTLAFVTNEDGAGILRLLDTAPGKELPAPRTPSGQVSGLHWHPRGGLLGFTFHAPRTGGDPYALDPATGKLERWVTSETGGLDPTGFPEPETVRWTSFDGKALSGLLYRPPARFAGKRPVRVEIHGGPEGQARPGFLGGQNYYLNEMGVALLFPNIRGSSGYGKTFLALDNGLKREDAYRDLEALLDWVREAEGLDGERIMISGGSYGGHAVLALATRVPDRYRCALDCVGMSNLATFLERTEGYRRDLRRVEYGDERDPEVRAFLERIAPLNHAGKIARPLFIMQGRNDPRVPSSEAEQMVAALRKNRVPVWYLLAENEGHGFSRKKNQDYLFYATILFMREHLLK